MAWWVTIVGYLFGGPTAVGAAADDLFGGNGNMLPAKVLVSLIATSLLLLLFRRFMVRVNRQGLSDLQTSTGVIPALAFVALGAMLLLGVTAARNPYQQVVQAEIQERPPTNTPALPQRTCPYADCGMGGPSVDPEDSPDKLRPEDFRAYLGMRSRSVLPSDVCSISGSETRKDLYDVRMRMSSGGICQRFFSASATSAIQLTEYKGPSHGRLIVDNRSFKYEAAADYRGSDAFLLQQCIIGQNLAEPSCTILRYGVELR